MLITYLQETFPDILTSPPNISDLTIIYKASKKRFDEDPVFKEQVKPLIYVDTVLYTSKYIQIVLWIY